MEFRLRRLEKCSFNATRRGLIRHALGASAIFGAVGLSRGFAHAAEPLLAAPPRVLNPRSDRPSLAYFGFPNAGRGSGDDAPAFRKAMTSEFPLFIPVGAYVLNSQDPTPTIGRSASRALVSVVASAIDWEFANGAVIKLGEDVRDYVGPMFRLTAPQAGTPGSCCKIRGMTSDTTGATSDGTHGVGDLKTQWFDRVEIRDCRFLSALRPPRGNDYGAGYGDTAISDAGSNNLLYDNILIVGRRDAGVYISGADKADGGHSTGDELGERCIVRSLYGRRNGNLFTAKRNWQEIIVQGVFADVGNTAISALWTNTEANDQGKGWTISGVRARKLQCSVIKLMGDIGAQINQIRAIDCFVRVADQAWTPTRDGPFAAVELVGCSHSQVTDISVDYIDYSPRGTPAAPDKTPCAVSVVPNKLGGNDIRSTDNMIRGVVALGPVRAIYEDASGSRNRAVDVQCGRNSIRSRMGGEGSSIRSFDPDRAEFTLSKEQRISSREPTKLRFDAEVSRNSDIFDLRLGRATPARSWTRLSLALRAERSGDGPLTVSIRKNGEALASRRFAAEGSRDVDVSLECEDFASGADFYEAFAEIERSSSLSVRPGRANSRFMIAQL